MNEKTDEFDYRRPIHWLPRPLNEMPLTACSIDLNVSTGAQFSRSRNEATCKNCLAARGFKED